VKKVKYRGNRRKGTLVPRRIWRPGEEILLEDEVARALVTDLDFIIVKRRGGAA
jgi:hypothetical protein